MRIHVPRPLQLSLLTTAITAAALPAAQAFEFNTGSEDWAVRLDNTVKYNYGVRTENADKRLLGTPNSNDGDYNFRKAGTNITNRVDLLTEFDMVYRDKMGFRISTASWYDKAYDNTGSNSNPLVNGNGDQSGPVNVVGNGSPHLSNYAQRYYSGPSGEVLDAFVFFNTVIGDESLLGVKAGQHNVFWGETLLSAVHSISYGQAGLDLAKAASSPGTEAKELFIPRNQISTTLAVNPELSFGAQYFLDWDAARLPEAGTYYGSGDVVGYGAQSLLLSYTDPLINVRRGKDYTPDDRGDWGVMAKWSPAWLDGTLGFYYRKTSDILPQAIVDARQLNPLDSATIGSVDYKFSYADNIHIYGMSLSKQFGGISIGSDLNYRENMPLASIPAIYSPALAADSVVPGVGVVLPARTGGTGVTTSMPKNGKTMSATGDTLHFTINAISTISSTPLFDTASVLGELYYSNLISLDDRNSALYKGKSSYRGVDKSTRDNWGVAFNFTPVWYQVFPSVDLSMPLTIDYGISGVSPVQGGGAEGTGTYSIGVSAEFKSNQTVTLKYVDAFGKSDKCNNNRADGATPDPLDATEAYTCYAGGYSAFSGSGATEDRGAVYLTLKSTF